jgi:hypothetical protein
MTNSYDRNVPSECIKGGNILINWATISFSRGHASDLYSWNNRLESQPWHRPVCLRLFVVFLSSSRQIPDSSLNKDVAASFQILSNTLLIKSTYLYSLRYWQRRFKTACSLVDSYSSTLKMEASRSSETLQTFSRLHDVNPEHSNFHCHRHENLKSHRVSLVIMSEMSRLWISFA